MPKDGYRVIDAWANLAELDTLSGERQIERLFQQAGATRVLESGFSTAELVQSMDAAGVDRAFVTVWHRPGAWAYSDERVARAVGESDGRLIGVAAANLNDVHVSVDTLRRRVEYDGFRALRIIPWLWNRPPNLPCYYPLYVACIELGIPVCTQVGHTGPLMPSEPGRPIPYLDDVACRFPELRIVGGHLGYPWVDEMISLAAKHENLFIDTSAHRPRYFPPVLRDFMCGNGRSKVLFGSNFPMLEWQRCLDDVERLDLPEPVLRAFLRDNACHVFNVG